MADDGKAYAPGRRERMAEACARYGVLPWLQRVRGLLRQDVRILAYHRVLDGIDAETFPFDLELVSADAASFRRQMLHVREHFEPMRLRDLRDLADAREPLPANAVVITFDDGYDDNWRVVFPILRELGFPATFFVSTGHIESGLPYLYDWFAHAILCTGIERLDVPELGFAGALPASRAARRAWVARGLDRLKTLDAAGQCAMIARVQSVCGVGDPVPSPDCRPMTFEQLREMHAAGMEIGSHGVHHRMLAKLSDADLERELVDSRERLQRELGAEIDVISYPVGGFDAYDDRVIAAAKRAGYRAACSYVAGTNPTEGLDWFGLRRLAVERHTSHAAFAGITAVPEVFAQPSRRRVAATG